MNLQSYPPLLVTTNKICETKQSQRWNGHIGGDVQIPEYLSNWEVFVGISANGTRRMLVAERYITLFRGERKQKTEAGDCVRRGVGIFGMPLYVIHIMSDINTKYSR